MAALAGLSWLSVGSLSALGCTAPTPVQCSEYLSDEIQASAGNGGTPVLSTSVLGRGKKSPPWVDGETGRESTEERYLPTNKGVSLRRL